MYNPFHNNMYEIEIYVNFSHYKRKNKKTRDPLIAIVILVGSAANVNTKVMNRTRSTKM